MNDDNIHSFLRDAAEPDLGEKALEAALDAAAADSQPFSDETTARMLRAATAEKAPTPPKTTHWRVWLYATAAAAAAIAIAFLWPPAIPVDPQIADSTKPSTKNKELQTGTHERRIERLADDSLLFLDENTRVVLTNAREIKLEAGRAYVEVARQLDAAGKRVPFTMHTPQGPVVALGTKFAVDLNGGKPEVLVTEGKVTAAGLAEPLLAGQWWRGSGIETAPQAAYGLSWTREMRLLLSPPPVPASDDVGGALRSVDGSAVFTLRRCHVDVHVEDGMARTTLDQTYFNHLPSRQEGTFYFPLPPDASISRLAMYVNGKLMEGGMAEREEARRTFETIKHKMQDPALLEWVDGSTFKMRVFPLEGREEKRIVISYVQKLETLHGRSTLRVPLGHSLGKTGQWSFTTRVKNGRDATWRSLHHDLAAKTDGDDLILSSDKQNDSMQRDVVLEFATPASTAPRVSTFEHEGARYLGLRWTPDLPAAPPPAARHWLFLVETTADRDRLLAQTQREVLRGLLSQISADDSFEIVTASTRTTALVPKQPVTAANRDAALKKLEEQPNLGALDLGNAFAKLKSTAAGTHIVHLGSATPILGETDHSKLLAQLPKGCVYASIGIGKRWNLAFARAAAAQTGGWFTRINPDEAPGWRAFEFMSVMNAARLIAVKLDGADWRLMSETLAHGNELCAVTKLAKDASLPAQIRVSGTLGGQPWLRDLKLGAAAADAGWLPRAWAKLELDRLANDGAEKHRTEIVALSKRSYVMSLFTSLLVLENDAMYEQYKIDRGRKDHWAMYACPESSPVVKEPLHDTSNVKTDTSAPKDAEQRVQEALRKLEDEPVVNLPSAANYYNWNSSNNLTVTGGANVFSGGISGGGGLMKYGDGTLTLGSGGVVTINGGGTLDLNGFNQNLGLLTLDTGGNTFVGSSFGSNAITFGNTSGIIKSGAGTWVLNGSNTYTGDTTISGGVLTRTAGNTLSFGTAGAGTLILSGANTYTGGTVINGGTQTLNNGAAIGGSWAFPGNGNVTAVPWVGLTGSSGNSTLTLGGKVTEFDGFVDMAGFDKVSAVPGLLTLTSPQSFTRTLQEYQVRGATQRKMALHAGFEVPGMLHDLTLYADGFMTTTTDRLSVAQEAAAAPLGQIDPQARALLDGTRAVTAAQSVTDSAGETWVVNAYGRAVRDWRNIWGLREIISQEHATLRHLYPEIGLGTERGMTPVRWMEHTARFPWIVPPVEALAAAADVKAAGEQRIEITPHDATRPMWVLVWQKDGRLVEKQALEPKTRAVIIRCVFEHSSEKIILRVLDAKSNELQRREWKTAAATMPDVSFSDLVVLPMPARRSWDSRHEGKSAMLASYWLTTRNILPAAVLNDFVSKGDTRRGLFVLAMQSDKLNARESRELPPLLAGSSDPLLAYVHHQLTKTPMKNIAVEGNAFLSGFMTFRSAWETMDEWNRNDRDTAEERVTVLPAVLRHVDAGSMPPAFTLFVLRRALDLDRDSSMDIPQHIVTQIEKLRTPADGGQIDAAIASEWLRAGDVPKAMKACERMVDTMLAKDRVFMPPAMLHSVFERGKDAERHLALIRRVLAHLKEHHRPEEAIRWAAGTGCTESLVQEIEELLAASKDVAAWQVAAQIYMIQSRSQDALRCVREVLKRGSPDPVWPRATLISLEASLVNSRKQLGLQMEEKELAEARDAALWLVGHGSEMTPGQFARQLSSQIETLGLRDLAHDLRTTPLALRPNESQPWSEYASDCNVANRVEEAITGYDRAFAAEGTNPQILLTHAQFLESHQRVLEARKLYQKIADGTWGPNHNWVVQQAKNWLMQQTGR